MGFLFVLLAISIVHAYNPGTSWRSAKYMSYILSSGVGQVFLSDFTEPLSSPKGIYSNDETTFYITNTGTLETVAGVNTNVDDIKYTTVNSATYEMLYCTQQAWAGLTTDGALKTWGMKSYGAGR